MNYRFPLNSPSQCPRLKKIGEIDPVYFQNPNHSNPLEGQDFITKSHRSSRTSHNYSPPFPSPASPSTPTKRTSLPSRPNLIGVVIRTLVNLRNAEILQVPISQIETKT